MFHWIKEFRDNIWLEARVEALELLYKNIVIELNSKNNIINKIGELLLVDKSSHIEDIPDIISNLIKDYNVLKKRNIELMKENDYLQSVLYSKEV